MSAPMTAFDVVCRFDEALDALAMGKDGVREFRETGDIKHAKFRDGKVPAVFKCRRLKASEMQTVLGMGTEADRYAMAFARGLTRVENHYMADSNGTVTRQQWSKPDVDRPLSTAEIDGAFDAAEVQEVGAAIFGRSLLGKGRPAAWPQPDTSRAAVGALVHHLAEQTRQSDASSAQTKNAPEAPPVATSAG